MNRASIFQQVKPDNYFPSGNRVLQRKGDFGNRELVRSENGQRQLTDNNSNLKSGAKDAVENRTGLSDSLKGGLESLSGMDLSGVKVHRNSSEPARVNALAYTQGQDIHVGPGQEKHLPHEGWHVVQQMQRRVKPTIQTKGVSINDDGGLEREADLMGAKANRLSAATLLGATPTVQRAAPFLLGATPTVQRFGPLAWVAALTIEQGAAIIGTATGVAAFAGAVHHEMKGHSGTGAPMFLDTKADYVMNGPDREALASIAYVVLVEEMEELHPGDKIDAEAKLPTAMKNAKLRFSNVMRHKTEKNWDYAWANGDGGRRPKKPYGEVDITTFSGRVWPNSFGGSINETATRHSIKLPMRAITFITSATVDYESHPYSGLVANDDVWVRGVYLRAKYDGTQMVIETKVKFDWDNDTTGLEWKGSRAITAVLAPSRNIPVPKWTGPTDPDD